MRSYGGTKLSQLRRRRPLAIEDEGWGQFRSFGRRYPSVRLIPAQTIQNCQQSSRCLWASAKACHS